MIQLLHVVVVPNILSKYILQQAHDALGHNCIARCFKQLYYWKWLHKDVDTHIKQGMKCRKQNMHLQHYASLQFEVYSMPMHFIVMDLIVKFKLLHQGHQYAFTVIDMLTNYT